MYCPAYEINGWKLSRFKLTGKIGGADTVVGLTLVAFKKALGFNNDQGGCELWPS